MELKTASSINLQKRSSVNNGTMQTLSSLSDAESTLTVDGMFGYVVGDGIYLNIEGVVSKISGDITDNGNGEVSGFYQSSEPNSTTDGDFSRGAVWYNTELSTLNIYSGTTWVAIGGDTRNAFITPWISGDLYYNNEIVLYLGDLWYNNTGSDNNTTIFIDTDWAKLTGVFTSEHVILKTQSIDTTVGTVYLDSTGLNFTISHTLSNQTPTVKVLNNETNTLLITDVIYTSDDQVTITIGNTLFDLDIDLKVILS